MTKIERNGHVPFVKLQERQVDPWIGQTVLGCRLESSLGTGACARVYRAWHEALQMTVGVKIAHPHLMETSARDLVISRFATEFEVACRVDHPSLVKMLHQGTLPGGMPVIVMEYVPGQDLRELLSKHAPLVSIQAAKMGLAMVAGLQALHKAGVLHRDINPNNIISSPNEDTGRISIKIVDFGVALLNMEDKLPPSLVGTPMYMAPEILYGQAQPSSDIYSMGAVLWWALTGREYGELAREEGTLYRLDTGQHAVPDPREQNPEIPEGLATLVQRMLSVSPRRRPSSSQIYRTLKGFLMRQQRAGRKHSDTLPRMDLREILQEGSLLEESEPHTEDRPLFSHSDAPRTTPIAARAVSPMQILLKEVPMWLNRLEEAFQTGDDARIKGVTQELYSMAMRAPLPTLRTLAEALLALEAAGLRDDAHLLLPLMERAYIAAVSSLMSG